MRSDSHSKVQALLLQDAHADNCRRHFKELRASRWGAILACVERTTRGNGCTCCSSGPDRWLDVSARKPEVTASTIVPDNTLDQGQVHTHTLLWDCVARSLASAAHLGKRGRFIFGDGFSTSRPKQLHTNPFQRKQCPVPLLYLLLIVRTLCIGNNPQCNLPWTGSKISYDVWVNMKTLNFRE